MNWKKVGRYAKYGLYILPFYGIIDQLRKPKEERSKIGTILSGAVVTGLIIKIGFLYGGKVATTGEWNLFKIRKEQVEEVSKKKENKLEKTIMYDEAVKSLENWFFIKNLQKDL